MLAWDLQKPVAVAKGLRLDGVRVLLVEDDEDTREVLTLGLELQGATVQAVGSAKDALLAVVAQGEGSDRGGGNAATRGGEPS